MNGAIELRLGDVFTVPQGPMQLRFAAVVGGTILLTWQTDILEHPHDDQHQGNLDRGNGPSGAAGTLLRPEGLLLAEPADAG